MNKSIDKAYSVEERKRFYEILCYILIEKRDDPDWLYQDNEDIIALSLITSMPDN